MQHILVCLAACVRSTLFIYDLMGRPCGAVDKIHTTHIVIIASLCLVFFVTSHLSILKYSMAKMPPKISKIL